MMRVAIVTISDSVVAGTREDRSGAVLAARAGGALPTWRQILWIVIAMVGARSAAMTMNRIADLEFDRRNPRTANRALPKGELSVGFAAAFTVIASGVLVFAAWQLNPLALLFENGGQSRSWAIRDRPGITGPSASSGDRYRVPRRPCDSNCG